MKTKNWIYGLLLIVSQTIMAQTFDTITGSYGASKITPNGLFDKVFDKDGREYNLEDISIRNAELKTATSMATTCNAGYFDLYFEPGSLGTGTAAQQAANQAVLCAVFSDISNFIISPLSTFGNTNRVNIWVRDIANVYPNPAGVAGAATQFYTMPSMANPAITGIVDGEVYKTIISGLDSYTNFAPPLMSTNNGPGLGNGAFFHGMVTMNFVSGLNWNTSLTTLANNSNLDMYSIVLHEVTHALGFASLVDANGLSKFGANYNYYSRYDLFLRHNNIPLINQSTLGCANYQYQFNPAVNINVMSAAAGCANDVQFAGNTNQPVFCPAVFSTGSSLSHFQDLCHPTAFVGGNTGYVMNPGGGYGLNFRVIQPEERSALCDLGYHVGTVFGTSAHANSYNYNGSPCPGTDVIGTNDGITLGGSYTFMGSGAISITGLLTNDYFGTIGTSSFECLEDITGGSTLSGTSGFNSTVIAFNSTVAGIHLLRYIPVSPTGQRGNITYVYVYVQNANCTPNACSMNNDSGFEGANTCGELLSMSSFGTAVAIDCWDAYTCTPDVLQRNCINTNNNSHLSMNLSAAFDTWNGAPNNTLIQLFAANSSPFYFESLQTTLNAPLIQNGVYTITFRGRGNTSGVNGMVTIAGSPNYLVPVGTTGFPSLPASLTPLVNIPLINDGNWHYYSQQFTYTGTQNLNNLVVLNGTYLFPTLGTTLGWGYEYIDDVVIIPTNQAVSLNLPATVCLNQQLTDLNDYLTPPVSGGVYTGAGVSVSSGIYSFNPSVAGVGNHMITYTYTDILGCVFSISDDVNVFNGNINVTASASAINVCANAPVTLTGGGALTYTWNPGNVINNPITVNPSSSTTYIVTGTDANGCQGIASVNVNVITGASISLATTASPNNPISGNAVTVNAIVTPPGTYSYAWSPNIGNTASVTFVPTDNATYTCNVTDQCGNVVSSSLCINLESSLCSTTSNITLNNTNITSNTVYSGQVITVIGTINITNCTLSFNSCTLKMSTNSKIIVDPTSIISMANSKMFSCEGMWFGIEAQSNTTSAAKVSIRGTSIEDAYNAIIANNNFANVNNSISLTSVTLNKNYIDVSISNASAATSYPLLIQSCDLTSNLSTTSPGNSLKCSGYYPVGTPAVKARSYAGLFADRAGVVILTNNNIGANFTKVSNKDYGLFLRRTDATVYNIQFRNIQSTVPLLATTPTLPIGVAIFSGNSRYLTAAPISAPVNNALLFNNVGYGIISNKTAALEVTNAVFNNPAQFSTNSLGVVTSIGSSAVYAIDADATLRINLNTISKVYNAITATYSVAPKAAGLFSISQNAITAGSGTLNTAIDILSTLNTPFTGVVGNQIVAANQITNASTAGVRMLNVTGTNGLRVSGNTITLKNIATGTRDGILLNGGNNNVMIDNNNVDGNLPGNNPTSYNLNCSGIRSVNSPGCYLQCNSITHTGKGIVYSGNNSTGTGTGAEFFNNKLNAPIKQGLVLTNGAIIGTQGNSTGASANVWNGFNATNSDQTMVGGPFPFSPVTNAINSILWVHNVTAGSVERPTDNQLQLPSIPGNEYFWNVNMLQASNGNITTCPNALTTGAKVILTPTVDVSQRDVDYSTYITTVVTPTANNASPQAKWMLKQHMHKAIRQTQLGNNTTVTNFYTAEQNGDAAKYYEVDSLLTNGDTILAKTKNNMAPLNNDMEQTHHDFNALYLSGITNATDYAALETIANLCADKYGNAVYQARALLNIVTYSNRDFEEDCDKDQVARMGNFEEEDGITVAENVQAKLFPNPNNGSFTLSYDLKQIPEATIKIMDVTGKEVYLLNIDNLNNLVQINSSNLSTGIYFIQLINNQKLLWTDKVVISN